MGMPGGNFLFGIFPSRRSEKGNVYFANYIFSFRRLQVFISQTTDFHFVSLHFVSFGFLSQSTVSRFLVCWCLVVRVKRKLIA